MLKPSKQVYMKTETIGSIYNEEKTQSESKSIIVINRSFCNISLANPKCMISLKIVLSQI